MKKSLLIVPAMATMLLAAAGSVGGTVAWFSANTTYDMTAGKFAVGALDGNLSVALSNIHGTTCNDKTVSIAEKDLIADASFDHTSGKLFTDKSNNDGVADEFVLLDTLPRTGTISNENQSKWVAKADFDVEEHDMHWAVAWKMAFTYEMPSTGIQQNLYFNNKSSGAISSVTAGETDSLATYKGFRIAFFPLNSENATPVARVWAPYTPETTASNLHYVKNTEKTSTPGDNIGAYGDELILHTDTLSPANEGTSDSTGANYLGCFAAGHANDKLTMNIACVAWFEGTDSNIRSLARKDVIASLAMNFYVLPNA